MQLAMTAAAKVMAAAGFNVGAGKLALAKTLETAGAVAGGVSAVSQGVAAKQASDFAAKQADAQGKAEIASASARAAEEDRRRRLVSGQAKARAAASGGGRDYALETAIEEEGTYRTLVANWEGQEAAAGLDAQATASRFGGKAQRRAGWVKGAAKGVSAYASLRDKYG